MSNAEIMAVWDEQEMRQAPLVTIVFCQECLSRLAQKQLELAQRPKYLYAIREPKKVAELDVT